MKIKKKEKVGLLLGYSYKVSIKYIISMKYIRLVRSNNVQNSIFFSGL
jgi:hypothetical protein